MYVCFERANPHKAGPLASVSACCQAARNKEKKKKKRKGMGRGEGGGAEEEGKKEQEKIKIKALRRMGE